MPGLNQWPAAERPNATIIFWSFRIMVGIGLLMLALGLWSLWQRWRDTLYRPGLIHWCALLMGPMGFVAVIAGWVTTEVGRQPYTIYGLLRTAEFRGADRGTGGRLFARRLRRRLFRGFRRRRVLHAAADGGAAAPA